MGRFVKHRLDLDLIIKISRKIAVLRSQIAEYKMTCKNVTNESEMKMALSHNGGQCLYSCFQLLLILYIYRSAWNSCRCWCPGPEQGGCI